MKLSSCLRHSAAPCCIFVVFLALILSFKACSTKRIFTEKHIYAIKDDTLYLTVKIDTLYSKAKADLQTWEHTMNSSQGWAEESGSAENYSAARENTSSPSVSKPAVNNEVNIYATTGTNREEEETVLEFLIENKFRKLFHEYSSRLWQSYNVMIEKIDLWVAVWVALMGVISIVLPIIVSRSYSSEFNSKIQTNYSKIREYKKEIENIKNVYKEEKDRLEKSLSMAEVSASLGTIRNIKNMDRLFSKPEQKNRIANVLKIAAKNNKDFADVCKNEEYSRIYMYLLDIQTMLDELDPLYNNRYALKCLPYLTYLRGHVADILDRLDKKTVEQSDKNKGNNPGEERQDRIQEDICSDIQEISTHLNQLAAYLEKSYKEEMEEKDKKKQQEQGNSDDTNRNAGSDA